MSNFLQSSKKKLINLGTKTTLIIKSVITGGYENLPLRHMTLEVTLTDKATGKVLGKSVIKGKVRGAHSFDSITEAVAKGIVELTTTNKKQ
jgi:hypothetical protein